MRTAIFILALSILTAGTSCLKHEIAGPKELIEKVGFMWYVRKGHVVAKMRKPRGVVRATIKLRMWEGDELILDPPPYMVQVYQHTRHDSERLIEEEIPPGVTRIKVELLKVEREDDLPPPRGGEE